VKASVPRVLSEKNLTLAELRELLEKVEQTRELTGLERYTVEYARKFAKIEDPAKSRRVVEELMKTFDLPEDIAVQLVNIKPRDPGEVRLVLSPLNKLFSEEDYRRIIEMVNE